MQDAREIALTIQASVAPVFLLSGIGALLAVLTNRIARIVDRARALEASVPSDMDEADKIGVRLATLSRRAVLAGRAITLCTFTAVLVCCVIAILFLSAFLGFSAAVPVALLFIASMLCLLAGLWCFLREVLLATATLRIGPHRQLQAEAGPQPRDAGSSRA